MAVPEFNLLQRDLLPSSPWRTYRYQLMAFLLTAGVLLAGWCMTLRFLAAAGEARAALALEVGTLREKLEAGRAGAAAAAGLRRRQELVPLLKGEAWSPHLARLQELAAGAGADLRGITLEQGVLTARVTVPGLEALVPLLRSLRGEQFFREYRLVEITAAGEDGRVEPGAYLEAKLEIQPGSAGGNDHAPVTTGVDGQG